MTLFHSFLWPSNIPLYIVYVLLEFLPPTRETWVHLPASASCSHLFWGFPGTISSLCVLLLMDCSLPLIESCAGMVGCHGYCSVLLSSCLPTRSLKSIEKDLAPALVSLNDFTSSTPSHLTSLEVPMLSKLAFLCLITSGIISSLISEAGSSNFLAANVNILWEFGLCVVCFVLCFATSLFPWTCPLQLLQFLKYTFIKMEASASIDLCSADVHLHSQQTLSLLHLSRVSVQIKALRNQYPRVEFGYQELGASATTGTVSQPADNCILVTRMSQNLGQLMKYQGGRREPGIPESPCTLWTGCQEPYSSLWKWACIQSLRL